MKEIYRKYFAFSFHIKKAKWSYTKKQVVKHKLLSIGVGCAIMQIDRSFFSIHFPLFDANITTVQMKFLLLRSRNSAAAFSIYRLAPNEANTLFE